jgi:hypothetical protein
MPAVSFITGAVSIVAAVTGNGALNWNGVQLFNGAAAKTGAKGDAGARAEASAAAQNAYLNVAGACVVGGEVTTIDVQTPFCSLNATAALAAKAMALAGKGFDIPHPTKEGFRLRYGVLEGPEHGVYVRGLATSKVIELPDYWTGLVHEDSITVQLTSVGKSNVDYVVKVKDYKIYLDSETGEINSYFFIQAERKDVEKVLLEYKTTN